MKEVPLLDLDCAWAEEARSVSTWKIASDSMTAFVPASYPHGFAVIGPESMLEIEPNVPMLCAGVGRQINDGNIMYQARLLHRMTQSESKSCLKVAIICIAIQWVPFYWLAAGWPIPAIFTSIFVATLIATFLPPRSEVREEKCIISGQREVSS